MNPFDPPREDSAPATKRRRSRARRARKVAVTPKTEVFTPGQIALATVLGWPLAAAWLIAWNYRTFGARSASPIALFGGVVATFLSFWTLSFFPPGMLVFGLFFAPLAVGFFTRVLQGSDIDRSLRSGAIKRPWSLAAGIGLLGLIGVNLVIVIYTSVSGPIYRATSADG
jgi:hypothetical protein